MDTMKLYYPADYHGSINKVERSAEYHGLDYYYEPSDRDEVVMVLEGVSSPQNFAGFAREVADYIVPTFGLEVYVPDGQLLLTKAVFQKAELEADYETRY